MTMFIKMAMLYIIRLISYVGLRRLSTNLPIV
mgnify:CR=1 FL=1